MPRTAKTPAKVIVHWVPVGQVRAVDGDTIALEAVASRQTGPYGVGLYFRKVRVRLAGVNCPELKGGKKGEEARAFTEAFLETGRAESSAFHEGIAVLTVGDSLDHYGRMVGRIEVEGKDLSALLLEAGHAIQAK